MRGSRSAFDNLGCSSFWKEQTPALLQWINPIPGTSLFNTWLSMEALIFQKGLIIFWWWVNAFRMNGLPILLNIARSLLLNGNWLQRMWGTFSPSIVVVVLDNITSISSEANKPQRCNHYPLHVTMVGHLPRLHFKWLSCHMVLQLKKPLPSFIASV